MQQKEDRRLKSTGVVEGLYRLVCFCPIKFCL